MKGKSPMKKEEIFTSSVSQQSSCTHDCSPSNDRAQEKSQQAWGLCFQGKELSHPLPDYAPEKKPTSLSCFQKSSLPSSDLMCARSEASQQQSEEVRCAGLLNNPPPNSTSCAHPISYLLLFELHTCSLIPYMTPSWPIPDVIVKTFEQQTMRASAVLNLAQFRPSQHTIVRAWSHNTSTSKSPHLKPDLPPAVALWPSKETRF